MKIHKNKLKKYIRGALKEAYLRDARGEYHVPHGLEPSVIFDEIKAEYEKVIPSHEEYCRDIGMDPYSEIFHTFPVIRAGVNVTEDYIGPIMAARYQGYDYVIEPDDFKDMHIKNTSIRKEVLPRMNDTHFLKDQDPNAEKIPFKIEVIDGATLSTSYEPPVRLKPVPSGDETVPRVALRNTAPLPRNDIEQTEEAPGVYPRTEDIPEDYDEDMTMDISDYDMSVMSAADRVAYAKSQDSRLNPGIGEQPFLPTGVVYDYDAYRDETIDGPLPDLEKGSMSRKYMDAYRGRRKK